jgi:YD repeat-containing protein
MKQLIILILISLSFSAFAQSQKDIVSRGIETRKYYETEFEDGGKEYLFKIEKYNPQGDIIEIKEMDEDGKIELWIKYKYDESGNLIEELELDSKGKQDKKIVHVYEKGLRVKKDYYDSKDRLYQTRRYEYEYRK